MPWVQCKEGLFVSQKLPLPSSNLLDCFAKRRLAQRDVKPGQDACSASHSWGSRATAPLRHICDQLRVVARPRRADFLQFMLRLCFKIPNPVPKTGRWGGEGFSEHQALWLSLACQGSLRGAFFSGVTVLLTQGLKCW